MNRLNRAFIFIIENFVTIGTIGFASYVSWQAATQTIDVEKLLSWILAILCLIAVSQFIERHVKLRQIYNSTQKTLEEISIKYGDRQSADTFFYKKLPSLNSYIEKAYEINLTGVVLSKTIRENQAIFSERLKAGAKIKVIIVSPESTAAQTIVNPEENLTLDNIKSFANETIQRIKYLGKNPDIKGCIELRLSKEKPPFNILAFDPSREYGQIFIEFYPQRWGKGVRPRMELTQKRDKFWFDYFSNQFDQIWEDCTPISFENDSNS